MSEKLLSSVKAVENFAKNLSGVLSNDYNIKLKPIKLLHASSKALGYRNWGQYFELNKPTDKDLLQANSGGKNTYLVGKSGSGKSSYIQGLLLFAANSRYRNIVILDAGLSYKRFAETRSDVSFNEITPEITSALYDYITVFELESILYEQGELSSRVINNLLLQLQNHCDAETLVIIDEAWLMPKSLFKWALTEFPGETLVSVMGHSDIETIGHKECFSGEINMEDLGLLAAG
ncbi:hypothetical protein TUM3794_20120 [Shewanella colwelliana]|uniref:AAA+ ATPase domain-containing protein n=1 Tax=Shewanella colwelliana TaxID=23 RepID=A0ABQ4P0C6_SHECO|nr:ATP-binding protein [Shewanella colwelliana]GIU40946.1 hypothetical protein TUM3794_20120 [Shewanella colwelliana]